MCARKRGDILEWDCTAAAMGTGVPCLECRPISLHPPLLHTPPAPHAAARGGYSSVTTTGPIANCAADAMLLYAIMANIDYAAPATSTLPPGAGEANGPMGGLAAAAAAAGAARAPPRPLGLPRVLLPLQRSSGTGECTLATPRPLEGLRVGVFKQASSDEWGVGRCLGVEC